MGKKKQHGTGAKTGRGRRILAAREPQRIEKDHKNVLMLYGNRRSAIVKDVLDDLYTLKRTEATRLGRLNEGIRPFEAHGGEVELERLCKKADEASLFIAASSTKKRKHNLVFGRIFDSMLYDAVEVGVDEKGLKFMRDFKGKSSACEGNKPLVVFAGEAFETDDFLTQFKETMLDLFRGPPAPSLNLAGVDRLITFAVSTDTDADAGASTGASAGEQQQQQSAGVFSGSARHKILMRQYRILFKKSGTKVPRVALEEMGLSVTMRPRRFRPPLAEQRKRALVALPRPAHAAPAPKNVERDLLRGTVGKVYVPSQDIDSMALRRMKGSKRKAERKPEEDENGSDDDAEDA